MDIKAVVTSQYMATLEMMKQAIERCPDSMWDDEIVTNCFWHIAYHALFYVHLYSNPTESDFVHWEAHRNEYQFMGPLPWPPHKEPDIGEPYTKEEVLAYLIFVQDQVTKNVSLLDMDSPSGFDWLPFNKLELQFYSIRHLQQHVGELCERLGETENIHVDWVGMKSTL